MKLLPEQSLRILKIDDQLNVCQIEFKSYEKTKTKQSFKISIDEAMTDLILFCEKTQFVF